MKAINHQFVALALLISTLLFSESAVATSPCAAEGKWAVGRVSEIARTLDGLLSQPRAHRRTLLKWLSPQEKADVWREHYARYRLARLETLTPAQLDLFDRVAGVTRPELYSNPKLAEATLLPFTREINALFSVSERRVYTDISFSSSAEFASPLDRSEGASADADLKPACDCLGPGLGGCGLEDCVEDDCEWQPTGCGWSGGLICTGKCKPPPFSIASSSNAGGSRSMARRTKHVKLDSAIPRIVPVPQFPKN